MITGKSISTENQLSSRSYCYQCWWYRQTDKQTAAISSQEVQLAAVKHPSVPPWSHYVCLHQAAMNDCWSTHHITSTSHLRLTTFHHPSACDHQWFSVTLTRPKLLWFLWNFSSLFVKMCLLQQCILMSLIHVALEVWPAVLDCQTLLRHTKGTSMPGRTYHDVHIIKEVVQLLLRDRHEPICFAELLKMRF